MPSEEGVPNAFQRLLAGSRAQSAGNNSVKQQKATAGSSNSKKHGSKKQAPRSCPQPTVLQTSAVSCAHSSIPLVQVNDAKVALHQASGAVQSTPSPERPLVSRGLLNVASQQLCSGADQQAPGSHTVRLTLQASKILSCGVHCAPISKISAPSSIATLTDHRRPHTSESAPPDLLLSTCTQHCAEDAASIPSVTEGALREPAAAAGGAAASSLLLDQRRAHSQPLPSQEYQVPASHTLHAGVDTLTPSETADVEAADNEVCGSDQLTTLDDNDGMTAEPTAKRRKFGVAGARQKHDIFLVYDFEATCDKSRNIAPVEMIELACVAVNARTMETLGDYQQFIRPTEHPRLYEFCKELTGIQQHQVDSAPLLGEVLEHHSAWLQHLGLSESGYDVLPVTWTSWDLKVCLETECKWRNLRKPPLLSRWCDLKKAFLKVYKSGGNLKSCVERAGLTWEGRAHSGLVDARNTAALAVRLCKQSGIVLRVTESFGPGADPGIVNFDSAGSGSLRQLTLFGPSSLQTSQSQQAHQQHEPFGPDGAGQWTGKCKCGVAAARRSTKKPGLNHGREFWSCGRWRITQKTKPCDFFLWV